MKKVVLMILVIISAIPLLAQEQEFLKISVKATFCPKVASAIANTMEGESPWRNIAYLLIFK
jgi:hypothetical protein